MSKYSSPELLATMTVHTASPVIFIAVLIISKILSIPIIIAIAEIGSPIELNTMDKVINPTDGIPAVPTDASVAAAITVKKFCGVN